MLCGRLKTHQRQMALKNYLMDWISKEVILFYILLLFLVHTFYNKKLQFIYNLKLLKLYNCSDTPADDDARSEASTSSSKNLEGPIKLARRQSLMKKRDSIDTTDVSIYK